MTNTQELRKIITEKGLKYITIASKLGISTYGLQLKIDNKNEFKQGEIVQLCKLLDIKTLKEKEKIFFDKEVDFKSTN
jgi:hypothetical protein